MSQPSSSARQQPQQGCSKKQPTQEPHQEDEKDDDAASTTASLDIGACCLCHCSLDFSDRAAFFPADRHEDYTDDNDSTSTSSYFFRPQDPYLPTTLYDPGNALVYCDSCDRMYHQKCHFVPLLLLPRGTWSCLLCQTQQQQQSSVKKKKLKTSKTSSASKRRSSLLQSRTVAMDNGNYNNRLFVSPPDASMRSLEINWEASSAHSKAMAWKQQLAKLRQFCQSQLASHRQASTALDALTSTRRNRTYYFSAMQQQQQQSNMLRLSQELLQVLVKLFGSKYKIRQALVDLESVRLSTNDVWETLEAVCLACNNPDFVRRVVFPFGANLLRQRRTEPRTREMQQDVAAAATSLLHLEQPRHDSILSLSLSASKATAAVITEQQIPEEIVVAVENHTASLAMTVREVAPSTGSAVAATATGNHAHHSHHHKKKNKTANNNKDDEDDSGISLDDLQCCICLQSDASDDNDMLLCDGIGCYRSYHQDCIVPRATVDEHDADVDWFCPICVGIADLLSLVQGEFMGDDWEQRRFALAIDDRKALSSDSLKSWEGVDDVFPEAQWEYETACILKEGVRNADTRRLLALVLGEELPIDDIDSGKAEMGEDADEDDEDEEDFDPDRADDDKNEGSDSDSSGADEGNSHASLGDLSSVALEIDQDEVAALSEGDENTTESDLDQGCKGDSSRRISRRLHNRGTSTENASVTQTTTSDQGKLDTSNILVGKRTRKSIDYVKLNEAMFGDASESALESIDDSEDYQARQLVSADVSSDNESDDSEDSTDESPLDSSAGEHATTAEDASTQRKPSAKRRAAASNRRSQPKSIMTKTRSPRLSSPKGLTVELSLSDLQKRKRSPEPQRTSKRVRRGVTKYE